MLDRFIELIIDCWTWDNTASSLIDNWLINAEHYTYDEIYKRYLKDEKERENLDEEEKEETIEEIHRRADENGHRFDDDLEETIAYWF
jgi:cobalamin biosynthesis Mg chelatase CobN